MSTQFEARLYIGRSCGNNFSLLSTYLHYSSPCHASTNDAPHNTEGYFMAKTTPEVLLSASIDA